jgi:hypothetical protein
MNRTQIINNFIRKYSYSTYLEIGVAGKVHFDKVICKQKCGVDPGVSAEKYILPDIGYRLTSDVFFSTLANDIKYDLIFIDGLHTHAQVDKDIENSLKHLNENGTIVLHDCSPSTSESEIGKPGDRRVGCNGTVWRAFYEARKKYSIEAYVIDTDQGCGVIRKSVTKFEVPKLNDEVLDFNFLNTYRKEVLNLISKQEFIQKL